MDNKSNHLIHKQYPQFSMGIIKNNSKAVSRVSEDESLKSKLNLPNNPDCCTRTITFGIIIYRKKQCN